MWPVHVVMWLNLSDWICQPTSIWEVSWPIRLLRLCQLRRSKGIRLYLQALLTQTSQGKKQTFDYGLLVHSLMPLATRHFIQQRAGCNVWYLFSCAGGGEDQQCSCHCLQWTQRTCYWYDPPCTVCTYQLLIIWEWDLKWGYMYVHIPSLIPRLPIQIWKWDYSSLGIGLHLYHSCASLFLNSAELYSSSNTHPPLPLWGSGLETTLLVPSQLCRGKAIVLLLLLLCNYW